MNNVTQRKLIGCSCSRVRSRGKSVAGRICKALEFERRRGKEGGRSKAALGSYSKLPVVVSVQGPGSPTQLPKENE
jgi:hypothetical protein